MPMTPNGVVAMLAIIKIGAIFLPLFSGFGAQPSLAAQGARSQGARHGRWHDARGKIVLMKRWPILRRTGTNLRHMIVLKRTGAVEWNPRVIMVARAIGRQPPKPKPSARVRGLDDVSLHLRHAGKPEGRGAHACGFQSKPRRTFRMGSTASTRRSSGHRHGG